MAEYRVYEIGDDGHIVRSRPLICSDDREAIEKASEFADGRVIEVWSCERFVTRLGPEAWNSSARS
jgi:hypothetical protein